VLYENTAWCGIRRLATPPSSESEFGGNSARSSYQSSISVSSSNESEVEVNTIDANSSPYTSTTSLLSPFPLSPPKGIAKSRRDRASLQKEANRSRQFTNRLQRSASESTGAAAGAPAQSTDSSGELLTGRRRNRFQKRSTASFPTDHGLKAIEPLHEHVMTKMAFAEQQKWITVQQKTFTKWYEYMKDKQRIVCQRALLIRGLG
jgi:hypothetical protein